MFHMQYPNAASPNNDSFHRHFCPNLRIGPCCYTRKSLLQETAVLQKLHLLGTTISSAWHSRSPGRKRSFHRQETIIPSMGNTA